MSRVLLVKVKYEDRPRKIQATDVKEERGLIQIFDGDKKVGEFSSGSVEHWSFVEEEAQRSF